MINWVLINKIRSVVDFADAAEVHITLTRQEGRALVEAIDELSKALEDCESAKGIRPETARIRVKFEKGR